MAPVRRSAAGRTRRGRRSAAVLAACCLTVTASCASETTCPAGWTPSTLEVRLAAAWPDRSSWDVGVGCDDEAGCAELYDTPGPDRALTVGMPDAARTVDVTVRALGSGETVHAQEHDPAWTRTTQPGPCGSTFSTGVLVLDVRHAPG